MKTHNNYPRSAQHRRALTCNTRHSPGTWLPGERRRLALLMLLIFLAMLQWTAIARLMYPELRADPAALGYLGSGAGLLILMSAHALAVRRLRRAWQMHVRRF